MPFLQGHHHRESLPSLWRTRLDPRTNIPCQAHKPLQGDRRIQYKIDNLTATEFYQLANTRLFDEKLPRIPIKWKRLRDSCVLGRTFINTEGVPGRIELNSKFRNQGSIWAMTLLHEMVHVEQCGLELDTAHGEEFQARMKELATRGAFDPFW